MKKLIVTLLVVFLALAWYSVTGLTEEETQIEEEYVDACSDIPIGNWEEKLKCCEGVRKDTYDQCYDTLIYGAHEACEQQVQAFCYNYSWEIAIYYDKLPQDCMNVQWLCWETYVKPYYDECMTGWIYESRYDFCMDLTKDYIVFECGDESNNAYNNCINN